MVEQFPEAGQPPGDYTSLRFSFSSGNFNGSFERSIDAHFGAAEGDNAVYIGNVKLDSSNSGRPASTPRIPSPVKACDRRDVASPSHTTVANVCS